jgi:hypothetical protein
LSSALVVRGAFGGCWYSLIKPPSKEVRSSFRAVRL